MKKHSLHKSPLSQNHNKNDKVYIKPSNKIEKLNLQQQCLKGNKIVKSTRNMHKQSEKSYKQMNYFKANMIWNGKCHKNKQNIKFPKIIANQITSQKQQKSKSLKNKSLSTKRLYTQPINITTNPSYKITQQNSSICEYNMKDDLLQILNPHYRSQITIEEEIEKLQKLTMKSGNLRKHLRSIQESVFEMNFKKRLSKLQDVNNNLFVTDLRI